MAGLRRLAVLALISLPIAAETVVGEVLFVGHIVVLVEALGFAWGLVAFSAIWAALGLAVLAVADLVWPRMWPQLSPLLARLRGRLGDLLDRAGIKAALAVLGVSGGAAAAAAAVALAGGEIWGWVADHRADLSTFFVAAAVVFAILLVLASLGRGLERWVRRIAGTAGPATRSFAALLSMVMLGPVLSWLLFRLLGYSSRTVYVLTLVSAPVFGAVWVPVYGLGARSLLQGLL